MSVDVVFAAMQEAVQADGPKIHKKFKVGAEVQHNNICQKHEAFPSSQKFLFLNILNDSLML
jgi:hypothetical protein